MFIKVEIWTVGRTEKGMAVLLRMPASVQSVPVYVEANEAQSILMALAGVQESPPRFPEFMIAFSTAVSAKPESIEILKGEIPGRYRAMVLFSSKDTRFSLDARTPDALAMAVRAGIPIFLDDMIPEEDGIGVSLAESDRPFATQLARLEGELNRRIDEEDYERAARIRDRINQIKELRRSAQE